MQLVVLGTIVYLWFAEIVVLENLRKRTRALQEVIEKGKEINEALSYMLMRGNDVTESLEELHLSLLQSYTCADQDKTSNPS